MKARLSYENGTQYIASVDGVGRCPHCSAAKPTLYKLWASDGELEIQNENSEYYWAIFACTTCMNIITVKAEEIGEEYLNVTDIFPPPPNVNDEIPETAKRYLKQALDTLHAPDAAALMAAAAVDAMLKAVGYKEGTLYSRITKAAEDHRITSNMADWAHAVRLESNRPRHSDNDDPHVSLDEARQCVEFAKALGMFMFVLDAKINKGLARAKTT